MKYLTFITITNVVLCATFLNAQNVPNGGFEEWVDGEPVNWTTNNHPGVTTLRQTEPGYTGSYAILGKAVEVNRENVGPNLVSGLDGFGIEITEAYSRLSFYYKFENGGNDRLIVAVVVADENYVTLGSGSWEQDETVEIFTEAQIPIVYSGTEGTPAYAIIQFLTLDDLGSGQPSLDSWFIIDDVSFSSVTESEPPTISDITDQTTDEDIIADDITFTINDPDTDPADLTVSGSSDNETLIPQDAFAFSGTGTDRSVNISPARDQNGSATITISVSDGESSASDTFVLTVIPQNDPPILANPIPNRQATEDALFSYQFPENTFHDEDGDELTYSATLPDESPLPAWLSFTPETRTFSGTPTESDTGEVTVKVTATDDSLASVSDEFIIYVRDQNDPPSLANPIPDQEVDEDSSYSYQFAENTFSDGDGDELNYTTTLADDSPLPDWLSFNPDTRTFSGTPGNSEVGAIIIKLTASDPADESVSDEFELTVVNTNDVPTLANEIPDQQTIEDVAFDYQFPENTFNDIDAGDELVYTAALSGNNPLPEWLSFSAEDRTFSGTPSSEDIGVLHIEVTASDQEEVSATDQFDLNVVLHNDPPVISDIDPQTFKEDEFPTLSVAELMSFIEDPDQADSLLTVWVKGGTYISSFLLDDSLFVFRAPIHWNGLDTLLVTASDGQLYDTAIIPVEVKAVNDAPFFFGLPDTVDMYVMEEKILDLSPYAVDPDLGMPEDSLRWQVNVSDESLQHEFDPETQDLMLTAPDYADVFMVTMTVTDDSGATAEGSFYVNVTYNPTAVENLATGIPTTYVLGNNYPNPFNPRTHIKFGLPQAGDVLVEIYNLLGQKIVTLYDGYKEAGYHVLDFEVNNLPTGIYFYRIKADKFQSVKKMMLMK